jgi:hypothetical protein
MFLSIRRLTFDGIHGVISQKYAVEMASRGMIYTSSFIKIGTGVQAILRF